MFERILVALDGSPDSRAAAELGIRVASRFDSRLTAQFVIDARTTGGPAVESLAPLWGEISPRPLGSEVLQLWKERSAAELDWFVERAADAGCERLERYEDFGLAEEEITARAAAADLVVMGRRGEHAGFGRHPIGSTLARVLRHSPHPVLVGRPARPADSAPDAPTPDPAPSGDAPGLPSDIPRVCLVAYDGREPATRALDLAIRYCRAAPAEIRLLAAGGEGQEALLEPAHRLCNDHDVEWESVLLDAEPADAVKESLQRWSADCLFMGAFGHGRIHDLVLGSKTEGILGAVSVPTFLVR